MKDKIYTEKSAYSLTRDKQLAILALRKVKVKSNLNEPDLVELILQSNPMMSFDDITLNFSIHINDLNNFNQILEIARAGFPSNDILILINKIINQLPRGQKNEKLDNNT